MGKKHRYEEIVYMRDYIRNMHDNPGWKAWADSLGPGQVYVIYRKYKEEELTRKLNGKRLRAQDKSNKGYKQMTIWDFLPEECIAKALRKENQNGRSNVASKLSQV